MDDIIQGQEPQGLFSKRSSSNILSDPRILAHLRIVAEEAQSSDKEDEESELRNTKRELGLKIAAYNKGNQHGAFRLILKEVRECFITKYIVEGMRAYLSYVNHNISVHCRSCRLSKLAPKGCYPRRRKLGYYRQQSSDNFVALVAQQFNFTARRSLFKSEVSQQSR